MLNMRGLKKIIMRISILSALSVKRLMLTAVIYAVLLYKICILLYSGVFLLATLRSTLTYSVGFDKKVVYLLLLLAVLIILC